MTEEEISQFNEKGCVSRCIIRHCAIANKPISRDDFVERYRSLFPEGEIGLLSLDRHCFILRDLGLCDGVYSVRNPDAARRAFRAGQTVYVLTDSGSADHLGHKPDHYHCRLAVDMSTHEHDPTVLTKSSFIIRRKMERRISGLRFHCLIRCLFIF